MKRFAFSALLALSATPASAMGFCTGAERVTCVVDGDTFWHEGEKIRLADIDAPESGGGCEAERVTSARSAARLAELLSGGDYKIERQKTDKHGRTLAVVSVAGKSVGMSLVEEHLARPWRGRREHWCEAASNAL